ncbi:MAG: SDR family NAD(P)-dependent oxidoreductase, partial [Cyanobacteria bacterium J06636_16]
NREQGAKNSKLKTQNSKLKTQNSSSEFRRASLFSQSIPNSEFRIPNSEFNQPALFALEYALAQLWLSWGIEPDGVMGHSIGEYVAACVAGVFSLEDGLRLVAARGRLMQVLPAGGGMVSVMASVEQVAKLLPEGVSIAAVNGPEATVISGDLMALAEVVAVLERDGIKHKALQVSHAFHSALMEPMLAEFKAVADTVIYAQSQIELVSNVTGQLGAIADADYWVTHVLQSVQFAAGINTLATQGYDTFIEMGPKPVMLAMGQACFPEIEALWLPSLRPDADWPTLLTSLGQLYASGAAIDWAGFDQSYPRQMVQLPNYPFQRQRYWIDDLYRDTRYVASLQKTYPPIHPSTRPPVHPLLGAPLPLAGDRVRYFEGQLRQDAPGYLQDHQVFREVLFPAAGYLEMAIAAAHSCLPDQRISTVLRDVSLQKGLLLPSEEAVLVQTVVTRSRSEASGSEYGFEIFSQTQSAQSSWQCHGRGAIDAGVDSQPSPVDIAAKQTALAGEMTAIAFYDAYRQRGIDYGPAFHVVEQVWQGAGEALAHICLSGNQLTELDAYHIHPVILDAGLQIAGATLDQQTASATYLPVGIEHLSLFEAGTDVPEWVYAQLRETEDASRDASQASVCIIDVQILTATGQAMATLEGLRLQPVSPELLLGAIPAVNAAEETWLYQVTWQPQPLPSVVLPADFLPSPETVRDQIAPDFTRLISQPEFVAYQALQPDFESLSLSYVIQALEHLGWLPQPGEVFTEPELAQQLTVAPQYQRLFHRCLQMLAEERILQQYGEQWELVEPLPVLETASIYQRIAAYPAASSELTLLSRCGERLTTVLRGELDPLTLLFPEGDLSDLTRLYEGSPGALVINGLVQRVVALMCGKGAQPCVSTVDDRNPRPMRILEIGSGTGGTTAHLLPHLENLSGNSGRQVEYVFTDVAPLFLSKARERFQAYPFVRYELLDIERSPVEQGFQQSFDLVIAANVLHATTDLQQTLTHVYELLAPGGELILLEGTQPLRWLDVIFGLTEGWWRFTDLALRPDYPLLSVSQWQHLLQQNGFTASVLASDNSARRLPQSIIVAQRDVAQPPPPATADWLILADIPDVSSRVRELISQRGQSAVVLHTGVISSAMRGWRQGDRALDWAAADFVEQLLQILQAGHPWQGIVYLAESLEQDSVAHAAMAICRRGLHLVQGILNANLTPAPRLYFVTQGATGLDTTELGLGRSPLWGFAKTVALEHPELRCTCLDTVAVDAELLVTELLADSPEPQVAFHQQQRHVARLRPYAVDPSEANSEIADQPDTDALTRLVISEPGTLANLTLQPVSLRAPAADEVAIQVTATGLNFRDVLTVLGQYPGEPVLGCECAGIVVNVGDQVQDLAIGQRVIGVAPNSFSQTVVVNRAMVIPVPDGMALEAAATIPVAFLTAYYSLVQLANLQPGECVLIHASTGGVGQAAIQIAQNIGAEIIATASPGKWDVLRAIGVEHIFNSRTLDFANEVMALTQGEGVDVVLNSLAGEFRQKSIEVLRQDDAGPCGRFVELGLNDLSAPSPENYFPVSLPALCQEQPELVQSMLQDLMAQFQSGTLRPLPQTVFPFTEVAQAFRTMQRAQHVGKLVVMQDREQGIGNREQESIQSSKFKVQNSSIRLPSHPSAQLRFHPNATYLITGGTGGLGLQVADWMIGCGARHLVLVSRRNPTAEVQEQIRGLTSQGVTVETVQADVSDRQALT